MMGRMRVNLPVIAPLLAALTAATVVGQTRQLEISQYRQPELFVGVSHPSTIGDVDGDGDLDAIGITTDPWFQTVTAILYRQVPGGWQQTGLMSFGQAGITPPTFTPHLVDLDGDGAPEAVLVVADASGANTRIELLSNDGSGTFTATTPLALPGATSVTFAAGDIDNDTDNDLIVATQDTGGTAMPLALYEHDGSLGFQELPGALSATAAHAPLSLDLDGDNDSDIIAGADGGGVLALINQGGAFLETTLASVAAEHVVGADLDGDNDTDLIVQQSNGSVRFLENTTTGFVDHPLLAASSYAGQRPEFADFDGDLDLDVAFQVASELRILRNDGSAVFTEERIVPAQSFAIGDVDLDGTPDVLFQTGTFGMAAGLARPDGIVVDPVFYRRRHTAYATSGQTDSTADLDNDGTIDILQQSYWTLFIRSNRGVGEWSTIRIDVPFLRPEVHPADIDGDGDQDLVVVNSDAAGGLLVIRNDGSDVFTQLPLQPLFAAKFKGSGDFDGDGLTDVLLGNGSNLHLLLSNGSGFGGSQIVYTAASSSVTSNPGIWDFDGDQDLDLIIRPWSGSCAVLLENDGSGNFTLADPCLAQLPGGTVRSLILVDIDSDGDPDIFTWSYGSGQFQMNDNGTFVPGQVIQGTYGSALLKPSFGDLDDDGYPDLLQLGGPAQVWINQQNGTLVHEYGRVSSDFTGAGLADLDGDGDDDHVAFFGASSGFRTNHHRSATSTVLPTTGGSMEIRYAHEPGYASGNAVCIPLLALQKRYTPLAIPGISGWLQIDLTTAVALPYLIFPATTGLATSSFAIPNIPGLLGFDLYAQGLVFSPEPGWTPAVHERVM